MASSLSSCVVVQLGQGGNQLSSAFFQALIALHPHPPHSFFRLSPLAHAPPTARAVLIDMESKVVAAALHRAKASSSWIYSSDRHITQDSGSGNNWARGFHVLGPRCRDAILNVIRLEVEACDVFGGFLTAQSMAGGTGAGLGAYVVESLKDEYPSAPILSHCIWPYETGEVIVQNYNALLTLSRLQDLVDGIIISQNESLTSICRKTLGMQRPSFDDMNDVVAHALASIFLPASWRHIEPDRWLEEDNNLKVSRQGSRLNNEKSDNGGIHKPGNRFRLLSDIVSNLCAHPGYRMLSLRFTPQISAQSLGFSTFTWAAQMRQLHQMLVTGASGDFDMDWSMTLPNKSSCVRYTGAHIVNRCLANLLVLRGSGSLCADVGAFAHESLYPIWSVDPLSVAMNSTKLGKYELSAGLLSNCQSTVMCASRALLRAYGMFSSRAYLHQYFEYGMENTSFEAAFATVEDVIARYLTL